MYCALPLSVKKKKCIVLDYFKAIFSSSGPTDVTKVVEAIEPIVSQTMNTSLTTKFKAEEVARALK